MGSKSLTLLGRPYCLKSFRAPGQGVLPRGKVENRRDCGQADARRLRHRVHGEGGFGALQRPWQVMNFETVGTKSCVDVVQAITLGQEVVQRAWLSVEPGTNGLVTSDQFR